MISSDELEKMAADEDYYNKNINTIDDAVKSQRRSMRSSAQKVIMEKRMV